MGKSSSVLCMGEVGYAQRVREILDRIQSAPSYKEPPFLLWEQSKTDPRCFSVLVLCRFRKNAARFLFDMVGKWLIPGRPPHIGLSFATEFQWRPLGKERFAVCELVFEVGSDEDAQLALVNMPYLEREILIGIQSHYRATKILEVKGLDQGEKTFLTQEKIGAFVRRFPKAFDYDIFDEMHHFFVTAKQSLKASRTPFQMSRLITTLYRFRKDIEKNIAEGGKRRHVHLRIKQSVIHSPFGPKEGITLYGGLNFLKEHELFEERHVLSSLSHFVPGIQSVAGSYYAYEGGDEEILTFAIEMEKGDGQPFSGGEIARIEEGLSAEIRRRIEQLVPPIFMPRNEEEVMRGVLTLSNQLKYLRDLPQMMISFSEQTDTELSFTVILVRILHSDSSPIRQLFERSPLASELSIDRVRLVGRLRRKYPKEACVFSVRLPSEDFLREDYSVDLFAARLHLVKEIEQALGPIRDFNGGMMAKQSENLALLKEELGGDAVQHALLLQNFFHSIFPVSLSTTLDPRLLKTLFLMLLDVVEGGEAITLKSQLEEGHLFVMAKFQDFSWKQKIFSQIEQLKIPSNELLTIHMQIFDSFYLGLLYLNPAEEQQKLLLETIPEALGT